MRRGYILLLIAGFLFIFLKGEPELWSSSAEKVSGQKGPQKQEGKPAGNEPSKAVKVPSEKPYTALVERNIFSPERKEFPLPISSPSGLVKKQPARPQVVLYGVTLAADYQSASIVHQGRSLKKGEREIVTVKVGDMIGEYKLKTILSDRILLEAEEDSFEILLYDPGKPKSRTAIRTETKPAAVTSALTGPAPIEPTRPGTTGPPTPEVPRPTVPPAVPGQERVAIPPVPAPGVPPAVTPPIPPAPQPTTPTQPPVYSPRRRMPMPGSSYPESSSPQAVPRESGGP